MNIKNRLEKLEKESNLDSEYCACPREIVTGVIYPDLSRTEEESQRLIAEAEKPEFCEKCRRQIEKKLIVVEFCEK